jgi:hypothetical protein
MGIGVHIKANAAVMSAAGGLAGFEALVSSLRLELAAAHQVAKVEAEEAASAREALAQVVVAAAAGGGGAKEGEVGQGGTQQERHVSFAGGGESNGGGGSGGSNSSSNSRAELMAEHASCAMAQAQLVLASAAQGQEQLRLKAASAEAQLEGFKLEVQHANQKLASAQDRASAEKLAHQALTAAHDQEKVLLQREVEKLRKHKKWGQGGDDRAGDDDREDDDHGDNSEEDGGDNTGFSARVARVKAQKQEALAMAATDAMACLAESEGKVVALEEDQAQAVQKAGQLEGEVSLLTSQLSEVKRLLVQSDGELGSLRSVAAQAEVELKENQKQAEALAQTVERCRELELELVRCRVEHQRAMAVGQRAEATAGNNADALDHCLAKNASLAGDCDALTAAKEQALVALRVAEDELQRLKALVKKVKRTGSLCIPSSLSFVFAFFRTHDCLLQLCNT